MKRVACAAVVLLALAGAGLARADADPASDVLYQHALFLPYEAKVSPAAEAKLRAAIKAASAAGRPVRVALIATKGDLGGVPQLFGNPTYYARFLDAELVFLYTGRVLVVMPNGAGLAKGGKLVADKSVIAAKPGPGGDGLARTAAALVTAISTGKEAPVPAGPVNTTAITAAAKQKSSGLPVGLITGIAIGVVALVLLAAAIVLARRKHE